jgi:hypothetical protein
MTEESTQLQCPGDPESILEIMRQVLVHDIQAVSFRPGGVLTVTWVKHTADEALLSEVAEDTRLVLQNVEMEELVDSDPNPLQQLFNAQTELARSGAIYSHLLVPSIREFANWLHAPLSVLTVNKMVGTRRTYWFAGGRLSEESSLPDGKCILLGNRMAAAEIGQSSHAVVFHMD